MQDVWGTRNDQISENNEFISLDEFLEIQKNTEQAGANLSMDNLSGRIDGINENPEVLENFVLNNSIEQRNMLEQNSNLIERKVTGKYLFNWGLKTNQPIPVIAERACYVTQSPVILGSAQEQYVLKQTCTPSFLETFA